MLQCMMGATNKNAPTAHIMHYSMNIMQLNCPVIFIVFSCLLLFFYCFVKTFLACFVMFRVDLFVTCLFIVTIVDIHMLCVRTQ